MKIVKNLLSLLNSYHVEARFYFDRLHLYIDSSTPESKLEWLLNLNQHNKLLHQELPHYEFLNRKLELFQVRSEDLIDLADVLKGDCAIQYVEMACDFEASKSELIKQLSAFFDKHLVIDLHPSSHKKIFYWKIYRDENNKAKDIHGVLKGTRYFADAKLKSVFTMYTRDQAKMNNEKACCHLEWRFSSVGVLKNMGLITLAQLIGFNHREFWNNKLDIREPNLTELGQLIGKSDKTTNRSANYKRGRRLWEKTLSLQNFLKMHPTAHNVFTPISTYHKLNTCLQVFIN